MSKMTIREQSEEITNALNLVMDEVLLEPTIPAIMKADLQQTVASELERLRNLNIYGHEVLWYNAMVAGNFIQKTVDAMQKDQQPSIDRRQWSDYLYQNAKIENNSEEDDDLDSNKITEDEIVDILVDELWAKLPSEPFPEQVEFAILEAAMKIESEEDICIEDAILQRAISEYNSIMTGE